MITVRRLNGKPITINALLIETIEDTPDTVITLTTGKKFMVLDDVSDVIRLVQNFLSAIGGVRGTIMSSELEGS
ncbi:flagellar FlbD family protein [Paenibacillus mesotrionivorans]|uniref:Flagellar FlbD family protein n=1 Tax=Paenibacillus mesotrionivorans TaxID=3160968 RepID=A0ACC7NVK0_9BACL